MILIKKVLVTCSLCDFYGVCPHSYREYDLQQKVEQLEKENKELRQPQVFIDCEDMEERYGRDLYEDYLKGKIEQLENIRKEAIDYIKKRDYDNYSCSVCSVMSDDLLNILNKGSDK